jgi:hypothetical protein
MSTIAISFNRFVVAVDNFTSAPGMAVCCFTGVAGWSSASVAFDTATSRYVSGLRARWYFNQYNFQLPSALDLDGLTPNYQNVVSNFDFPQSLGAMPSHSGGSSEHFIGRFDGYFSSCCFFTVTSVFVIVGRFIAIPATGSWTFCVFSDDISRLFMDGTLVCSSTVDVFVPL